MLDDKYIVEKSKSLVWAQFRDYGAEELKILDTYLSRINARDPSSSLVTFTKKEYAELMGLDPDLRTEQLRNYTKGLLRNVVTIDLPGQGYVQYPLFSEAKCYLDEDINQVVVTIECNEKLKSAFFSIAQNGYIKYELKNVIALKSQYSVRLYPRLKDRPHGWTVGLDELKELLGATAPSYSQFKHFKQLVLSKAIKEINEITDINVKAENVQRGKAVVAIKFTVTQKVLPELPPPEDYDQSGGEAHILAPDDPLAIFMEDLPPEFTREQVQVLKDAANAHVPYEVGSFIEKDLWISDYIQSKVRLMHAQNPPVKSKFGWLRAAVTEDWQ